MPPIIAVIGRTIKTLFNKLTERATDTENLLNVTETPPQKLLSRPIILMDILEAFLERGASWGENDAVEIIITRVSDVMMKTKGVELRFMPQGSLVKIRP